MDVEKLIALSRGFLTALFFFFLILRYGAVQYRGSTIHCPSTVPYLGLGTTEVWIADGRICYRIAVSIVSCLPLQESLLPIHLQSDCSHCVSVVV